MGSETEHPGVDAAEQAAAMLAAAGMPRMPARVMMALVGSPDAGYTAAELGDRLGVSAAAVSGAVRYLVSMRFIQRLSRAGDRRDRYDLVDDAWAGMIAANAPLYTALASQMEQIADENTDAPTSTARAREIADFLRFLAARMPELADEWRAGRAAPGSLDR
ncbi:DNA-binding transcriptional regulator GbsR (MarR family) [Microbacterium terrae]|uniref:MarR family protein n=1 Tax=Microbacterium terrae TaxID=69369 RepID=A0A0M2H7N0_9MICO|nr:helix-turn-helix domain-containing protein [Microbacterium terrae]KJL40120.1 MarR family protein [Microbacterium terrae]MBP1079264.1 DNA-binding transcriptional regulator GbsR (MarR family) [Microbacterium terrae]GLJ98663.1 transcriptional regulator [Microbacterium terrae]